MPMIRRINHTGRKRILREQVRITVDGTRKPATFTADLSLESHKFNSDASVIIEAYRGSGGLWMPFDWGRIAAMRKPAIGMLTGLDSMDGLLFRVRVVAVHEPHKILGEADQLPFTVVGETPEPKQPLIKTRSAELGDLVWDIDFDADSPELLINQALGNWKAVTQDKTFRALVYPTLLREILTRIIAVEKWPGDSDSDDWRTKWLKFAKKLASGYGDSLDSDEQRFEFIAAAVSTLAMSMRARESFLEHFNPVEE